MTVHGLDHVNILVRDLDASAKFYEDALGLRRGDPPAQVSPDETQWMFDPSGRPIIHLGRVDLPRNAGREVGGPTGALHHVALSCSGFDETCARLDRIGVPYRAGGVPGLPFKQIFVTDPSGISLELNFPNS